MAQHLGDIDLDADRAAVAGANLVAALTRGVGDQR